MQEVAELIPWHIKSKTKLRGLQFHISMESLWKVQKSKTLRQKCKITKNATDKYVYANLSTLGDNS